MQEKAKRLRVLAGPNGSGKSSIIFYILSRYNSGVFLNADELHKDLEQKQSIDLSKFNAPVSHSLFTDYLNHQGKSWLRKAEQENRPMHLTYQNDCLVVPRKPGPFDAAIAADFLRYRLMEKGDTFTFETVLSDERKLDFLQEAVQSGYRVYLYFVCTVNPEINKLRVANRVAKQGHDVPPDRIEKRYYRSLEILSAAIPFAHRCFLFDNSKDNTEEEINLVAEIVNGTQLTILSNEVPWWVETYVINKIF